MASGQASGDHVFLMGEKYLNKLLFPLPTKASEKVWLNFAQQFQRKRHLKKFMKACCRTITTAK